MKLSIVMMVKNESKNISNALSSLETLRNEIDSELIIMDTGSSDDTVEIAKKFTKKVYFEKWNNNFADMRNKSISYASGDWIFIMDADEVLSECNEILDFFKSSKNKKYNTGFINIKNFTRKDKYNLHPIARFFKNTKDFRYQGAIHEQPVIKEPVYLFKNELIHYGYFSEDKNLMDWKFERNVEILKNELDKEPENIYYWHQISQSYGAYGKFEESLKMALKAYEIAKKKEIDFTKQMYLYTHLALVYYKNNKFYELRELCVEALSIKDGYLDLYFFLGKSQMELGDYSSALKSYKEYKKILFKKEAPKDIDVTVSVCTEDMGDYVYLDMCVIYNKEQEYEELIDISKLINDENVFERVIKLVINAFLNLNKHEELKNYYSSKVNLFNENSQKRFIEMLEECIIGLEQEEKVLIWESFVHDDSDYSLLNKIRINMYMNCSKYEIPDNIQIDFNSKEFFYADLLMYILKKYADIEKYFKNISEKKIEEYCGYLITNHKEEFLLYLKKYIIQKEDIEKNKNAIIVKCLSKFIIFNYELEKEDYKLIYMKYIDSGIKYLEYVYNYWVIEEKDTSVLKNDEEIFLLNMIHALKEKDKNRINYVQNLRLSLECFPKAKGIIYDIIKDFEEEFSEKTSKSIEMQNLQIQFKENIKIMIEKEDMENAAKMIKEYETFIGEDLEIYSIKSVMYIIEGKLDIAEETLKNGLLIDGENVDILYNLAYLYEIQNNVELAVYYYNQVLDNTEDEELINMVNNALESLK